MNIGDTLICKKDLIYVFNKNETYTISSIDNNDNSIFIDNNDDISGGVWFYHNNGGIRQQLYDYFYTKEELRQFKLQSL